MNSYNMPVVLATDVLKLSPGLIIRHGHIFDTTTGAVHHVQPAAKPVISMLATGTPYEILCEQVEQSGLSVGQLNEIIAFLNSLGALQRQRALAAHFVAWQSQLVGFVHGIRYGPLAWRRPADYRAVFIGVCRAAWPVAAAAAVAGALSTQVFAISWRTIGLLAISGLGLFGVSLYLHELAHSYAVKQYGRRVDVLQIGLRLGLLHVRLHPSGELYAALIGPTIGSMIAVVVGVSLLHTQHYTLCWISLVIAVIHLLGLLPWYGDGASILRSLRHWRVRS